MATTELDPLTGLPKKKTSGLDLSFLSTLGGLTGNSGAATGFDFGDLSGAAPIKTQGLGFNSLSELLSNPDAFRSLILNDPTYKQTVGDLGAQGVTDAASRDAALRRGLVQFGSIPDFTGQQFAGLPADVLGGIANADTRSAADKFTGLGWSTLGQLNTANTRRTQDQLKAFTDAKLNLSNALGARGLARSGEALYQNEQLQGAYDQNTQRGQQDYEGAKFNATQQLVDYLAGTQAAYLSAENARKTQARAEAEATANRLAQLLGLTLPAQAGETLQAPAPTYTPTTPLPTAAPEPRVLSPAAAYTQFLGGAPVGGPAIYQPAPKKKPLPNLRYSGGRPG